MPALAGHDRQRVDVAGLALIGAHAGGGEALDVLDRLEAFVHGEAQVLGRDVVLEVDERLDARRSRRHRPCRQQRPGGGLSDLGLCGVAPLKPAALAASRPALDPSAKQAGQATGCRRRHRPNARAAPTGRGRTRSAARRSAACRATARTDARSGSNRRRRAGNRSAGPAARRSTGLPSARKWTTQTREIRRRPSVATTAEPRRMRTPIASATPGSSRRRVAAQIDDRLDRDAGAGQVDARRHRRCHCW